MSLVRGPTREGQASTPAGRYPLSVGIAIGIAPHTGWAWLVRVRGESAAAVVESRARIVVCHVLDGQLFHLAAEHRGDPAEFLAGRRQVAVAQARLALEPHLGGVGAAVVLGKRVALDPLERILAAHPLIHGAEGELWRAIFAEACLERGVAATRSVAEEVRGALMKLHGSGDVAEFLAAGRRQVGPPWSREPQEAALAAWFALRASPQRSRWTALPTATPSR